MSAEIVAIDRAWRYVSADPVAPDPRAQARHMAELAVSERRNVALAKRKAAAPLTPKQAQAACDIGLFSDDAAQSDLVDMARTLARDE